MAEEDIFATVSKDCLDIYNLKDVLDASKECATKWNPIGLYLGLSQPLLQQIAAMTNVPEERLQRVLVDWLQKNTIPGSPDPSYYILCHAIAGGNNRALADRIARAHPAASTDDNQLSATFSIGVSKPDAYVERSSDQEAKKMYVDGPKVKKYPINTKSCRRGIAIIINNVKFAHEDDRPASEKDARDLEKIFTSLRYEVIRINDLKADEIRETLKNVAEKRVCSTTDDDSFICCILSHGCADGIMGTDYKEASTDDEKKKKLVKTSELAKLFDAKNCPKLCGKPKLFFLQACRGTELSEPMKLDGASTLISPPPEPMEVDGRTIPPEADFLFSFSTSDGTMAARSPDPDKGTPYIQELCDAIDNYSDKHSVNSLLLILNDNITQRTFVKDSMEFKQMPEFRSTMRKEFMFK